jgi:hypothetical protein
MLHVLREASVQRAAATFPHVHEIGNRNMAALRELGDGGWRDLLDRDR